MLPVALSQIALALACGSIGVRLLLLYRSSRRLPELLLGVSLLATITCMPLLVASGVGGSGDVSSIRFAPLVLGFAVFTLNVIGLSAFTWQTFRPESRWGWLAVAAIGAAGIATAIGATVVIAAAPAGVAAKTAAYGWLLALRVPSVVNFSWTGTEAFLQWRLARRRMSLGLGDPVVTNRFALWCAVGVFATANNLVSIALQAQGMGPVANPVGAAVVAVAGVVSSVLLWLVFLPPARYRVWVMRRAIVEAT